MMVHGTLYGMFKNFSGGKIHISRLDRSLYNAKVVLIRQRNLIIYAEYKNVMNWSTLDKGWGKVLHA